jgi:hypothetical protein
MKQGVVHAQQLRLAHRQTRPILKYAADAAHSDLISPVSFLPFVMLNGLE